MSVGQPFTCVLSRGYSFDGIYMKLFQNVNQYKILVKLETGQRWVKNKVTRSDLSKT